jgi:hypothetical protein
MAEIGIAVAAGLIVALVSFRILFARRPEIGFANEREERLSYQLAQALGCPLEDAQAAVRRELTIAPDQMDETILKRARYHYQREAPEHTCAVYRERTRG